MAALQDIAGGGCGERRLGIQVVSSKILKIFQGYSHNISVVLANVQTTF
jgi:hypothetical protein